MIDRIVIENYKSIKKVDIKLSMINVLIGSNGAGKSNFISFFKFLSSITQKRMQIYIQEEAGAEYILYHGRKVSENLKARIELTDGSSTYYEFNLLPNTEGTLFFSHEGVGYRDNSKYENYFDYSTNLAKGNETGLVDLKTETRNVQPIIVNRLNEYRIYHFHDTGKTARVKQSFNLYDNEFLYEDARNLASFLYKLQQTNKITLERIEKTIRLIAPYFDKFVLAPNPFNKEEIRIAWREKSSEMLFNANHFSDGTLRMICLITLFFQPQPPKTIILDEPELGLHPFALTILSDLIKKVSQNGIQVIISTQSIPLVEKFRIEDIVVVDKIGNESVLKKLDLENLKEWLDEYSIGELWEMNLLGGRP
ncbi:AAA family ATPase [Cetobacterium sp.]|uniref:AAA family ATPase n=1 Tax=Cetobacterium sp. TaxID=2071632 RepID=UPI003F333E6F